MIFESLPVLIGRRCYKFYSIIKMTIIIVMFKRHWLHRALRSTIQNSMCIQDLSEIQFNKKR